MRRQHEKNMEIAASKDRRSALIDVVLPVFNSAATIAASVNSILAQSVKDIHVIIVDDGSVDATPEIVSELARRDARITVVRKENGGIVEALDLGLSRGRAPYVARQDADDISYPDRFERQLAVFQTDTRLVGLSGSCLHIDDLGRRTGTRYIPCNPETASFTSYPSTEPYLLHPFLMMRREAVSAVGGYRYVHHAEDTDLYWRLREIGTLRNLPEPLGDMRLHSASISNASLQNGRIMAVSSQLAAISARRRAEGRADLTFSKEALDSYRAAPDLRAMVAVAGLPCRPDERHYLSVAAAVKLLELSASRHYELNDADCSFVRSIYSSLTSAEIGRRSVANWAYRAAFVRLVRGGFISEWLALSDPKLIARTFALRLFA